MFVVRKIALFGVPGAGKGTQAKALADCLKVPHISTGDMFRALQNGSTELALMIKEIVSAGQLVPDELVAKMTFERLAMPDCKDGFILDGFPRTLAQAQALQGSQYKLQAFIEICVAKNEIIRRLGGRRVCDRCHAVYHIESLAGVLVCPSDGNKLIQRVDDLPQAIETRLDVFQANVAPVIDFYLHTGLLVSVDGQGDHALVLRRILQSIDLLAGHTV